MYGYIYLTTNMLNGTVYIGKHKADKKDMSYYGSGKLLVKAINKYGKENFSNIVIDKANSPEELNEKEIFWIGFYKNKLEKRVYNITIGGDGVAGFRRSMETRRKISLAQTGDKNHNYGKPKNKHFKDIASKTHKNKIVSEETREKLRQYRGEKNSRFGVKLDEDTKKKISNSNKGRKVSETGRKNMSESKKGSRGWLNGKKLKDVMPEHYENFRQMGKGKPSPHRKKVVVMDKDRNIINRFDCIKHCADYYNTHISCIQKVLSGKQKTYKKLIIEYDNTNKKQ